MFLAQSLEVHLCTCVAHVYQEILRKGSILDVAEDLLHGLLGLFGDDLRAGDVSAVLSSVGYGVPHSAETGLIDQVNDQFHLMDALEVCISRIIASLNQRFEACLHKGGNAAAQNSLLTEQVGLSLCLIGCLKEACARSADRKTVCKRQILCLACVILLYSDQARCALACNVLRTNSVARSLRSDHGDVDIFRRYDAAEMNVEAMREHQHITFFQVRLDIFAVQLRLLLIIDQDHDDISLLCSLCRCVYFEALLLCSLPASGSFIQTDDDLASGISQIQCMSMTLAAVADDCDCLAFQKRKIAVFLVKDFCCHTNYLS